VVRKRHHHHQRDESGHYEHRSEQFILSLKDFNDRTIRLIHLRLFDQHIYGVWSFIEIEDTCNISHREGVREVIDCNEIRLVFYHNLTHIVLDDQSDSLIRIKEILR
jgi:hypothetical protein